MVTLFMVAQSALATSEIGNPFPFGLSANASMRAAVDCGIYAALSMEASAAAPCINR